MFFSGHITFSQILSVKLLKDILSGQAGSDPWSALKLNENTIVFFAKDNTHGVELWKTDGTSQGTQLVKDVKPGSGDIILSDPTSSFGEKPLVHNGILYFKENNGTGSNHIWRSDGTAEGTYVLVSSTIFGAYPIFTVFNNQVYFWVTNANSNEVLYKTSGTVATTEIVRVFPCGGPTGMQNYDPIMFVHNNLLYFMANDELSSCSPYGYYGNSTFWKTDGTNVGTVKAFGSFPNSQNVMQMGVVNNQLFFTVRNNGLWKSDFTNAGTIRIKSKDNVLKLAYNNSAKEIIEANNLAYFLDSDGLIWRSDGTLNGTYSLGYEINLYSGLFIKLNGQLYFNSRINNEERQLMTTDGTVQGTVKITNLPYSVLRPCVIGNSIYFSEGGSEPSIWKSDGTTQNTVKLQNTYQNNNFLVIYEVNQARNSSFLKINNKIFFIGFEYFENTSNLPVYGKELRFIYEDGVCTDQETTKSGDWDDPTVWSCGISPQVNHYVLIKSGHNVNITNSSTIKRCKKVYIENGATLNHNGNLSITNNP